MKLDDTAIRKRAKKLELQESKKIESGPADIHALELLLHDVYTIISPKPSDYQHRNDLVKTIDVLAKDKIRATDGGIPDVEAFGSFIMDMFTCKSDLDLSVNFAHGVVSSRDMQISVLRKFSKVMYSLQSRGHVFGVTPILKARVPILKVVDRGTGVECDISVENRDGIMRSGILRIISSIDERFRKLCFLTKAWAAANGINSSKDRTLNSLSLILLVAFHFQTRSPPILPPFAALLKDGTDITRLTNVVHGYQNFGIGNRESLAELFVTLLTKLLSVETLWPKGLCASAYEGCWISKTWDSGIGNISVEDFTDQSQNCARSVGKVEVQKIYKCIRRSLDHITSFKKGKKQAADLKVLLFGPDAIHPLRNQHTNNSQVKLKRNFPLQDAPAAPLNPIPTKRMRFPEDVGRRNQPFSDITSHMDVGRRNQPFSDITSHTDVGRRNQPFSDITSHVDVGRRNQPFSDITSHMVPMSPDIPPLYNAPAPTVDPIPTRRMRYPEDMGRGNLPLGDIRGNMVHMYNPYIPPNPPFAPQSNYHLPRPPLNFGSFHPNPMFPVPSAGPGHFGTFPPYPYGHR